MKIPSTNVMTLYAWSTFLDLSFAFLQTNLAHLVKKIWQKTQDIFDQISKIDKNFSCLKRTHQLWQKPQSNRNKIILSKLLELKPYLEYFQGPLLIDKHIHLITKKNISCKKSIFYFPSVISEWVSKLSTQTTERASEWARKWVSTAECTISRSKRVDEWCKRLSMLPLTTNPITRNLNYCLGILVQKLLLLF